MDLAKPQNFNRTFDWVMFLAVGELIPKNFEAVLIENVVRSATEGIVVFWGIKRAERTHMPNQKDGLEVIETFSKHGFVVDDDLSMDLVTISLMPWYKIGGIFVFWKNTTDMIHR